MSDIERTKSDKAFVKSWSVEISSKVRTKLSATHSPFVFEENQTLAVCLKMISSEVFFILLAVLCLTAVERMTRCNIRIEASNFKKNRLALIHGDSGQNCVAFLLLRHKSIASNEILPHPIRINLASLPCVRIGLPEKFARTEIAFAPSGER